MLTLHASWPGYFASTARRGMLEQVKQSVEAALAELEARPTLSTGISGFVHRSAHLERLASGEVEMLFQPMISLATGRPTKLEALARLRGPDGLVPPAEFLPAFGDDELFTLFEHGVQQALDAVRSWETAGLVTGASVNLPVAAGEDDRYLRTVVKMLASYGLAPDRLTLEVLETGFLELDTSGRRRPFDDFKDVGVRLAQDDLGSGHSSLLRLRHFAFDDVKIDRSLVRGAGGSSDGALHFLKPINNIAHSLGLSVVVEGLEDDGLIEAAFQLGVDEGQGFGIARPMPAHDVPGWAAFYRLDLDAARPRTPLGALAAHVNWEHRVSAVSDEQGLALFRPEACPMTSYAAGDPVVEELHRALHRAALTAQGCEEHRTLWEQVSLSVLPKPPG